MDFQTLLPYFIGAMSSFVSLLAKEFLPRIFNSKYYKIAFKVFPLVDATLADNFAPYGGSGVRKIVQEVVLAVTDGELSPTEVVKTVDLVMNLFNPEKAADNVPNADALLVLNAVKTATSINELDLGGIKFSFK